jgi:hypothetical protein
MRLLAIDMAPGIDIADWLVPGYYDVCQELPVGKMAVCIGRGPLKHRKETVLTLPCIVVKLELYENRNVNRNEAS